MLSILMLLSAARADDGQITLDPTVPSPGVYTCTAAPHRCTLIADGAYSLSGDFPWAATAISVNAAHVTLDLNGYTIRPAFSVLPGPTDVLIELRSPVQNFRIQNGGLEGGMVGLSGTVRATPRTVVLRNLLIADFTRGIVLEEVDGVIMDDVSMVRPTEVGARFIDAPTTVDSSVIQGGVLALEFSLTQDVSVRRVSLSSIGIPLTFSQIEGASLRGSLVARGQNGVVAFQSDGLWVRENAVSKNSLFNIDLLDSATSVIRGNFCSEPEVASIHLDLPGFNNVEWNAIHHNRQRGIHFDSTDNIYQFNRLTGTGTPFFNHIGNIDGGFNEVD